MFKAILHFTVITALALGVVAAPNEVSRDFQREIRAVGCKANKDCSNSMVCYYGKCVKETVHKCEPTHKLGAFCDGTTVCCKTGLTCKATKGLSYKTCQSVSPTPAEIKAAAAKKAAEIKAAAAKKAAELKAAAAKKAAEAKAKALAAKKAAEAKAKALAAKKATEKKRAEQKRKEHAEQTKAKRAKAKKAARKVAY